MDKNKNGIPDKTENMVSIVAGCVLIIAGVAGVPLELDTLGIVSLCTLGAAMISEERVIKYLKNKD